MTRFNCECRKLREKYFGSTEYFFHRGVSRCELKDLGWFTRCHCLMWHGEHPWFLGNRRENYRGFSWLYSFLHFPDWADHLQVPDIGL